MSRPADYKERQRALDPSTSFAVTAPAGSGKTGLLTQRVLKLLQLCDNPEEVLCITFTRKAAAEMAERIIDALQLAATEPEPEAEHDKLSWQLASAVLQRDRECNWQLLDNPGRLRIQTIDGLCRSIARQLPLSSGIGALPDTLDLPEQAYQAAVSEFLQTLKVEGQTRTDLLVLLSHLDNQIETLQTLLISLLARRDQWMPYLLVARHEQARSVLEATLEQLYREHMQMCAEQLAHWASDLSILADFAGSNLLASAPDNPIAACAGMVELPGTAPEDHQSWLSFIDLVLTKTGGWRARITKNEGFPADGSKERKAEVKARKQSLTALIGELSEQPQLLDNLAQIRGLPPTQYSDSQWQLLDSLTRLLPQLAAYLRISFQQLAATDFGEITQAALQALGSDDEPGEALLKLDYQISHVLVDEFQDTASPQMQLLERLTAGWQAGDGRTLFIVGDGMQSCYGFRDANVGLFLEARSHGIGAIELENLDLSVNFRSQAGVVEWVNQTFKSAYPERDDISRGAVSYSASGSFKPALAGTAVHCYACIEPDENSANIADARHSEAVKTLELVQEAQQQDPEGVTAILVRNRPHLKQVLQQLTQAGISWQATEIDPLISRAAIVDLLSLTRASHDPSDRITWLALLRSPLIGLSLNDLHALANFGLDELGADAKGVWPLLWHQLQQHEQNPNISPEGSSILKRCLPLLVSHRQELRRKSLRTSIQGLWLSLGGPAALIDRSDIDNCDSFFTLLEKHDSGGRIENWDTFNQAVTRLYAQPASDANPKLQVMTIHKSKGLEFDTVIIPGLDKRPRTDDKELILWQQRLDQSGHMQLLLGPLAPAGEDTDPLYRYLRDESQRKDRLESTRLLYVGCTRAVKKLHLLAACKIKKDDLAPPSKSSLLHSIWPSFIEQAQQLNGKVIAASPEQTNKNASQAIVRLKPSWQPPVLVNNDLLMAFRGNYDNSSKFDDIDSAENLLNRPQAECVNAFNARHCGTVIHAALEQLVLEGLGDWNAARIETVQPFWRAQLLQLGVNSAHVANAVERVSQAIKRAIEDKSNHWIFDRDLQGSACELSLQHRGKELIVDRTFVRDNTRWIVDYKSSEPNGDETERDFLARESDTYRAQLKTYAEAFAALDERPIHTALYFPNLKVLHEVDFRCPQTAINSLE